MMINEYGISGFVWRMYKREFKKLARKYRLRDVPGKNFFQSAPESQSGLPSQGMKVHISCGGLTDEEFVRTYIKTLKELLPDLVACGMCFKVASIELALKWHTNPFDPQRGKLITIYESACNGYGFFKTHADLFYKDCDPVMFDRPCGGSVFMRYGNFTNPDEVIYYQGQKYEDDRFCYAPYFIGDIDIKTFNDACYRHQEEKTICCIY